MLCVDNAKDKVAVAKLREAIIELLARSQLFGLTLLGHAIRVYEKESVETMETDGRSIWYSPRWVLEKSVSSVGFDLCHEEVHIVHNHPKRCGNRIKRLWDYACEIRVAHDALRIYNANPNMPAFKLEDDHIEAFPWAKDLSTEQIYDELVKDPDRVPQDFECKHMHEPMEPETESESEEFRRKLTQDLVQNALVEQQSSKKSLQETYGSSIWERLEALKRCDVPWHSLLQGRLAAAVGQEHASWIPPNRRFFPDIVMPSRRGSVEDELLLGIDVSGSITDEHIARFRSCVLPAARRAKKTTVVTFDAVIREMYTVTRPEQLLRNLRFKTGTHSYTDVRPVFEEVDKRKPSAVAIITDGYVKYPDNPYPKTHWVLTPGGFQPPWGSTYRMHFTW